MLPSRHSVRGAQARSHSSSEGPKRPKDNQPTPESKQLVDEINKILKMQADSLRSLDIGGCIVPADPWPGGVGLFQGRTLSVRLYGCGYRSRPAVTTGGTGCFNRCYNPCYNPCGPWQERGPEASRRASLAGRVVPGTVVPGAVVPGAVMPESLHWGRFSRPCATCGGVPGRMWKAARRSSRRTDFA